MATFLPSKFSPTGQEGRSNPDSVRVQDVPGDWFIIRSNGMIEVVKTGRVYDTRVDPGASMIRFLLDRRGNKELIESVLGGSGVAQSTMAAKLPVPAALPIAQVPQVAGGGAPDTSGSPGGGGGLMQQVWFWPVVIMSGVGLIGAAIYFWPKKSAGGMAAATANPDDEDGGDDWDDDDDEDES